MSPYAKSEITSDDAAKMLYAIRVPHMRIIDLIASTKDATIITDALEQSGLTVKEIAEKCEPEIKDLLFDLVRCNEIEKAARLLLFFKDEWLFQNYEDMTSRMRVSDKRQFALNFQGQLLTFIASNPITDAWSLDRQIEKKFGLDSESVSEVAKWSQHKIQKFVCSLVLAANAENENIVKASRVVAFFKEHGGLFMNYDALTLSLNIDETREFGKILAEHIEMLRTHCDKSGAGDVIAIFDVPLRLYNMRRTDG
jgi:hypothetical protein